MTKFTAYCRVAQFGMSLSQSMSSIQSVLTVRDGYIYKSAQLFILGVRKADFSILFLVRFYGAGVLLMPPSKKAVYLL
jgi:hypothetical protein